MTKLKMYAIGLVASTLSVNAFSADNSINSLAIRDTIQVYNEAGALGLVSSVKLCYEETYKKTGNMFCIIKDMSSKVLDDMGARGLGIDNQEIFESVVFERRLNSACKLLLKRTASDCNSFLPKTFDSVFRETLEKVAQ